ncbi:hypothetical protein Rs2_05403 [Raphanus sativus]|nr:hypothetical protein Rs2_05403 [Raphanus sativus]
MVLRTKPDPLTLVLKELRQTPTYHDQDKLPLLIWMIAQAFQYDLPAALYSWAWNLLPLVANYDECYTSQSIDLIPQFVEMILSSYPEARAVLLNRAVTPEGRLIPPCSFEILVRLTFPAPSARVEATLSDTLTVKNVMNIFRMKNEKAITEGVANLPLYKEADHLCKLIFRCLSRGSPVAPLKESCYT